MTNMMDSPAAVIMLMIVLVLVLGGILIGVRIVGGRQFNDDHDR